MNKYEKSHVVGSGTFGIVYQGVHKETQQIVAMKKIRMGNYKDGISFTAIREIKMLQDLRHENIVVLMDIFMYKHNVYLVFEFMEYDLECVIKDRNVVLTPADIKSFMLMLCKGVECCHKNWILHRDLKPNNLLISKDGLLKIADFGFARHFGSPNPRFTHNVVTRWYRAPELLFGAKSYGSAIDIWAVGCIFAELMLRTPYFPGDSDMDQLAKIFAALGTPTEEIWPGMSSLPDYVPYNPCIATPFKQLFTAATDEAIDLLSLMLKFDPDQRCTATEALKHPYFSMSPEPTPPEELPKSNRAAADNPNPGTLAALSPGSRPGASPRKRPLEDNSDRNAKRKLLNPDDQVRKKLDFVQ